MNRNKLNMAIVLTVVTIVLLFTIGAVYADHYHNWTKLSETTVQDRWGSAVQQCVWECSSIIDGTRHTTITQGHGWCPRP